MCACCTIHPSEAPERLGLRVLRARGCRGGKQQKVGWSKTMVWPPSAPSQMCMGRGARNQMARVCCEHVRNLGVRPPSDSGSRVAGSAFLPVRSTSGSVQVPRPGHFRLGALGGPTPVDFFSPHNTVHSHGIPNCHPWSGVTRGATHLNFLHAHSIHEPSGF